MARAPRNRPAADAGVLLPDDDQAALDGRLALLDRPHVAPLVERVRRLRDETGEDVPWPDPLGGGVRARVVLLRRDPRCSAVRGARLATAHRDDPASGNLLTALDQAGLPYAETLLADVVPWWVEDPDRHETPGRRRRVGEQARRAAPYLLELLGSLPSARAVVLLGGGAATTWRAAAQAEPALLTLPLTVLTAPSPSPLAWHMRGRDGVPHREHLVARLAEAAQAC